MTTEALIEGRCRYCACTEEQPCADGCAWTDASRTLCTVCLGAAAIAIDLVRELGILAAKPKVGLQLTKAGDWDALDLDQQRALVMTCRTYLDAVQLLLGAELAEAAQANAEEIDSIGAFLLEHCPEEVARVPDAPISAIVTRLLEPHVGSRIVLPGVSR